MFVGLGQVLGRAFDAYPNRVLGYTLNIVGSLVGFSLISLLQLPSTVWFSFPSPASLICFARRVARRCRAA
jgi:hypothetical protein